MIHEMGGTWESWDAVCLQLRSSLPYLRYDTRGAGLSEKIVGETDIDTQVDDLTALLDGLGIDGPVALAGVAVGAAIAIRFAARQPQRVSHLMAMAPAYGVAAENRSKVLAACEQMRRFGVRDHVASLLERGWPPTLRTDSARFREFQLRWRTCDPQSFSAIFRMLATLDLESDLRQLPPRSILVAGRHDQVRPPAEIERLGGLAPQAETLEVESRHFMPVQNPNWVAALLTGFVDTNQSAASLYRQHRDLC
jgi:3-oxoadipate enol-lactonase